MTDSDQTANLTDSSTPGKSGSSEKSTSDAGRPGSLLVIFLTVFIDLLGFGIVLPLLPLYADQFGEDPSGFMIGMLMAIFSIMQFIFAPIWGAVSDKVGRRPVIIVGLVGSVVFYTLFGIATIYQSLTGLFLTRIGAGIAGATVSTAQAYIADTTSNENRARGMALIGVAFGLGFTLGPLFAYFAVAFSADEKTPGAGPGFVAAGLSLVALVLAIFVLPESKTATSTNKAKRWYDPAGWKIAFETRALVYLLIGFFICIFAFANFETTLSMLIKGSKNFAEAPFDFTFREVCGTFALIGLMVAIVQGGIVRRLAKKIAEQKLAVAGAVIEVAGFGVMTYAVRSASTVWLFTALAIIVTGYSLLQPSLYSLLSRWSDPSEQGKVLGVGQSVSAMARIFGSALGIPMLKATLFLPYIMASVLMVAVAGMIMLANKSGKDF